MNAIAERLGTLRDRIDRACERAGRDPAGVRLLPVTKTHPASVVRELHALGCRTMAENKVQEVQAKDAELGEPGGLEGLRWAFVGHLQRNKVKALLPLVAEFHALDTEALARELDRRLTAADRSLDVYIQVNSSGEDSKFGLPPDEVAGFARRLTAYPALRVRGLMTLASPSPDPEVVAGCFATMAALRTRLRDDDRLPGDYPELSMGMSGDFEAAVAHGATVVRLGTALLGAREYPAPRQ